MLCTLDYQLIMASNLFLLSVIWLLLAAGSVDETFSFVNSPKLRGFDMEYHANYRAVSLTSQNVSLTSQNAIFQLVFCNTTPNAYALCIVMGYSEQAETRRIVWTANRNDPVQDNAILKYGTDGNLLLSDVDGRVVWSTKTSNKGVVGVELRNNGNLVLYDKLKKSVWQSFDHATDSLLVGQSLNIGGVKKLVSRVSNKDGSEGPYSLAIEAGGLALYAPSLRPLWALSFYEGGPRDIYAITHTCKKPVSSITFLSDVKAENGYRQMIKMSLANFTARPEFSTPELCNLTFEETNTAFYGFNTPRFNTTLSFLRLEFDGDLKMYTYSPDMELNFKWDITFQRFGCWRGVPDCGLQMKSGELGVVPRRCQCVTCAQSDSFKGSHNCGLPSLADCKDVSSNSSLDFYKLSSQYVNVNPIGETDSEECRRRCSHDCYTCAAFLQWEPSSECGPPTVGTAKQLGNRINIVFVKKTQF